MSGDAGMAGCAGTSGDAAALPAEAYAAALVYLPGMGPARLAALLQGGTPETIWRRVAAGEILRPGRGGDGEAGSGRARVTWAAAAARRDVAGDWRAMQRAGIAVAYLGGAHFPALLAADPEPPGVVFWQGDLPGVLACPRVAVIGTRHATGYGRTVAAEISRDLAECGICVVSGLALGIDGAAHEGALRAASGAGPLGIAASGVDHPYPVRHTDLWRRVIAAGAVLSETGPGQPAQAWRFPARNRLIAALAQVVVVVESHTAGGSMLTVAAAAERGVEIVAVPGPVTSASSAGTNQLLHEGVAPARHAGDVLSVLGDLRPWPGPPSAPERTGGSRRRPGGPAESRTAAPGGGAEAGREAPAGRGAPAWQPTMWSGDGPSAPPARRPPALDPAARRVLDAVDRTPTPSSLIADRTGLPVGALSVVLLHLEALNLVRGHGAWWERSDRT